MSSTPAPAPPPRPVYWEQTFDQYYDAYLLELYSGSLAAFWSSWDQVSSILVALTAAGSTIAGWTLWQTASGKVLWAAVSAAAALVAVVNSTLKVPQRVTQQSDLRSKFRHIRIALGNFRDDMADMPPADQKTRFEKLRDEYNKIEPAESNLALTKRGSRVQTELNEILKKKGRIL